MNGGKTVSDWRRDGRMNYKNTKRVHEWSAISSGFRLACLVTTDIELLSLMRHDYKLKNLRVHLVSVRKPKITSSWSIRILLDVRVNGLFGFWSCQSVVKLKKRVILVFSCCRSICCCWFVSIQGITIRRKPEASSGFWASNCLINLLQSHRGRFLALLVSKL